MVDHPLPPCVRTGVPPGHRPGAFERLVWIIEDWDVDDLGRDDGRDHQSRVRQRRGVLFLSG
jgi:hypothetical protein